MSARGGAQSIGEAGAAGGVSPSAASRKTRAKQRQAGRRNYANGASAERRIKRELEARGAFVVRAAGSHGCADLVALWPSRFTEPYPDEWGGVRTHVNHERIWLIQVKRGNGRATAEERTELIRTAKRLAAVSQIVTVRPRKPDAWECLT